MKCSCDMLAGDFEGDLYIVSDTMEVAIDNSIRCSECKKHIHTGDKYNSLKGLSNYDEDIDEVIHLRDVEVYNTCSDCISVIDEFFNGRYTITGLWNDFYENFQDMESISEECIANLTPVARSKVCDIIEGYWDNDEDEEE